MKKISFVLISALSRLRVSGSNRLNTVRGLMVVLMTLAAIVPARADRYLTFGDNDTLRVSPSREDGTQAVMVRAHFDGRLDQWYMTLSLPQGVRLAGWTRCEDMLNIPYTDYEGNDCTCSASLIVQESDDGATVDISSSIREYGYWKWPNPQQNFYNPYGTVKWEAGDYDRMFELVFKFDGTVPEDASIGIDETLLSTEDQRGMTLPATRLIKTIRLIMACRPGDVDGDGQLTVADVTALIDLLLYGGEAPDGVSDVDGDGQLTIADVTALIDQLFS